MVMVQQNEQDYISLTDMTRSQMANYATLFHSQYLFYKIKKYGKK